MGMELAALAGAKAAGQPVRVDVTNVESSVCYWCAKHGIPVFCPAWTDGSMGDMTFFYTVNHPGLVVDTLRDVDLLQDTLGKPETMGCLVFGGGLPKHHLLRAACSAGSQEQLVVCITTGIEADGCVSSSCQRDDASCGLTSRADMDHVVRLHCDASIAVPLLLSRVFGK